MLKYLSLFSLVTDNRVHIIEVYKMMHDTENVDGNVLFFFFHSPKANTWS